MNDRKWVSVDINKLLQGQRNTPNSFKLQENEVFFFHMITQIEFS